MWLNYIALCECFDHTKSKLLLSHDSRDRYIVLTDKVQ